MELIILMLIIITNATTIAKILKRKIEYTIPIAVIIISIIVYLGGLCDNVNFGVQAVEGITIISAIYNLYIFIKSIKEKKIKEEIKRIITPRIICIYSILYIIYYNKQRKSI